MLKNLSEMTLGTKVPQTNKQRKKKKKKGEGLGGEKEKQQTFAVEHGRGRPVFHWHDEEPGEQCRGRLGGGWGGGGGGGWW